MIPEIKKPDWAGKIERFESFEGSGFVSWKQQRERVLKRDGYVCRKCGDFDRRILVAHHTSYKEKSGSLEELDLLITLCQSCHNLFHRDHIYDGISKKHKLRSLWRKK